ncbi:MAG: DNA-directed DNA polymerase I [Nitrososphaerales archaeon]
MEGREGSLSEKIKELTSHTTSIPPSVLLSATYDGEKKKAVLKFYHEKTGRIYFWYDTTGHKPYCYTRLKPSELGVLEGRNDVVELRVERKTDLLKDTEVEVTRIVATDPLAIGGPSKSSIRDVIDAWEADIKYYENYLYDSNLICGAYYTVEESIKPIKYEIPSSVERRLQKILEEADPDLRDYICEWASLLSQPLPHLRRVSLDIEVLASEANRIPNPEEAAQQVIAAAMVGDDGLKKVLVLKRNDDAVAAPLIGEGVVFKLYENESDLIREVFSTILQYPILVTFNGDQFDLNYLYHRAQRLGFSKDEIPITLGRDVSYIKHGVHIDLYKTFNNRSLQIYAFGGKYVEHTLGAVAEALLEESKIDFEGEISELSAEELARYCYNDAHLAMRLTTFKGELLCKLLIVLCRIAKMPLDDVSRLGVSNWIRSMLFFEHRRRNILIPKQRELEEKGGAATTAIIKGKKYKGGVVIEPKAGVYFDVSVLDFASLYPSIIKVYNLSYETVRCIHEECRSNIVPETNHWTCKKKRGITSLLIGSLRDLRVNYYKHLAKERSLSEDDRELYGIVSQALKVILNASYGVMGAEIFPLYCLPVAEATAALGRYVINRTIEKSHELGIEVIYGDTDSLFLRSPNPDQLDAIKKWAESELNIELELDKTYRYVAFSQRKKNYMGVLTDGKVDVKGLTGKKSHIPAFIKQAFYDSLKILSEVKTKEDFDKAKDSIRELLRKRYLDLKNRRIPLQDLAFNVMIGKAPDKYTETTPQHVRAAKLLMAKGKEVKAGEIIAYVKTITPPGVKPISMATPDEVDTVKYLEQLKSTFDQILDALGYEFNEIMGVTKLEEYFWGGS